MAAAGRSSCGPRTGRTSLRTGSASVGTHSPTQQEEQNRTATAPIPLSSSHYV
eukprot:CAMPEP_0170069284 /NCGR_PEP_ID=MMETSP0019_2-20121128/8012_1 /TAXON_ID=98059 /ORGANISM="Dinobryon sp., Strain UTEXLB2267" /LENGTH=52 /DNA_ID=CAMNT_0010277281 /DNA_START=324 /DNA_END=482 /DNA_ORIENTATION=+